MWPANSVVHNLESEQVFSLAFRSPHTVQLIDPPTIVVDTVRRAIVQSSYRIRNETERENWIKLEISGCPFSKFSLRESAVSAKQMCCLLLMSLRNIGWELSVSSLLTRESDHSTLFFQKVPGLNYRGCRVICLSPSGAGSVHLVNSPRAGLAVLEDCAGDIAYDTTIRDSYFGISLKENLWKSHSEECSYEARSFLLRCFRRFHNFGYRFYGTANIKGTTDCLFFIKDNADVGPREYCIVSLNSEDEIRCIGAPPEVIDAVRQCVLLVWPHGIQRSNRRRLDSFDFKLVGFPWKCSGKDAVKSRVLLSAMFCRCVSVGWSVLTALSISRKETAKSVFIMRRCAPSAIKHFAMYPSRENRLRIVNATDEMIAYVADIVRRNWGHGISKKGFLHGCYEIKLRGYPWRNYGSEFGECRLLMNRLMYGLALCGWRVVCSADLRANTVDPIDRFDGPIGVNLHCWFVAHTGHAPSQSTANNPPTINLLTNGPVPDSADHLRADQLAPPSYTEALMQRAVAR